jgi:hypothetical protein
MDKQEHLEAVREIKQDIKEIKNDLSQHMARTAASEARLEVMEDFVMKQTELSQKNFETMVNCNEKTLKQYNKQMKILLGVFAALATLVGALAAWINH